MEIWKNGKLIETAPDPVEPDPPEEEDLATLAETAYVNSELALAMIEELEG